MPDRPEDTSPLREGEIKDIEVAVEKLRRDATPWTPTWRGYMANVLEAAVRDLRDCQRGEPEKWKSEAEYANRVIAKIRDVLPPGPAVYLWEAVASVVAERDRLKTRVAELLITVKNLSLTTPYPEESGNVATLIAEVGTLKARVAELERRTGGDR